MTNKLYSTAVDRHDPHPFVRNNGKSFTFDSRIHRTPSCEYAQTATQWRMFGFRRRYFLSLQWYDEEGVLRQTSRLEIGEAWWAYTSEVERWSRFLKDCEIPFKGFFRSIGTAADLAKLRDASRKIKARRDCVDAFCTYLGELEYQHKLPPAKWAIPPSSPDSPDEGKGGSSTSTFPASACFTDRKGIKGKDEYIEPTTSGSGSGSGSGSEDICPAHTLALHYVRDWAHLTSVRAYATWIQDILQRVPFSWPRQTPQDRLIPAWRRRMIGSRRTSTLIPESWFFEAGVVALAQQSGLSVSAHVLQKAKTERQKRRPRERAAREQEELMRRCREVLAKARKVKPENTTIVSITDNLLDNVARLDRWTMQNGFKWEGHQWCHTLDTLLGGASASPSPSPSSDSGAFSGPATVAYLVGVARRAANQLVL